MTHRDVTPSRFTGGMQRNYLIVHDGGHEVFETLAEAKLWADRNIAPGSESIAIDHIGIGGGASCEQTWWMPDPNGGHVVELLREP